MQKIWTEVSGKGVTLCHTAMVDVSMPSPRNVVDLHLRAGIIHVNSPKREHEIRNHAVEECNL